MLAILHEINTIDANAARAAEDLSLSLEDNKADSAKSYMKCLNNLRFRLKASVYDWGPFRPQEITEAAISSVHPTSILANPRYQSQ